MYNIYKCFDFFARPMRVEKPYATKSAVSTVNALSSAMSIGERIKDLNERMGHVHPRMMMRALEGKPLHGLMQM
jgi:hypothetical protein